MSMKVCLLMCVFIAVAVAYPPFYGGGPRYMPMRPRMVAPVMTGYPTVGYRGGYPGGYVGGYSSDHHGDIMDAQADLRDSRLDNMYY